MESPATPKFPSALNALAWSSVAALLTGLATCMGQVSEMGRYAALGLYTLSRPTVDQVQIYRGLMLILSAAVLALSICALAYSIFWAINRAIGWLGLNDGFSTLLTMSSASWIALFLVLADAIFLNAQLLKLKDQANGLILKGTSEAGTIWPSILMDTDRSIASSYELVYGAGLALFGAGCWWLLKTRFGRLWKRIAFSVWVGAELLSLLFGYAYMQGVAGTVDYFPLVDPEPQLGIMGSHPLPILMGADDKQFALLVVYPYAKPNEPHKLILFVPRTEVKFMTVLRLVPLQPLAKYDEFKDPIQPSHDDHQ